MARKRKSWKRSKGGLGESGSHTKKRGLQAVQGSRKRNPPKDSVLRKKPRDLRGVPWKTVEALYCAGVPAVEIAVEYPPVTVAAINKRAQRGNWMTPAAMKKRALALIDKSTELAKVIGSPEEEKPAELVKEAAYDDPAEALALKIAEGAVQHQNDLLNELARSIAVVKKGAPIEIKTMGDLEKADNMARRTLGLEKDDAQNQFILNINSQGSDPVPIVDV